MPNLLREAGFQFHFYSAEGEPLEPPHIHVRRGGDAAKLWLTPDVVLQASDGFSRGDLRRIERIVRGNRAESERRYNEWFAGRGEV